MVNYYGQSIINYRHLSVRGGSEPFPSIFTIYLSQNGHSKKIERCTVAPSNILDTQLCFVVLWWS